MTQTSNSPSIVVIGGGTGSFTLLGGLKQVTDKLTALVNMSDDGGSTGKLRDELGVLPPEDVRQCLVAMSDTPEVRDLFSYRFGKGSLAGQSLGNIILSGLELQHGSFADAIQVASTLLHIKGRVIPITLDNHVLILRHGNHTIKGQYNIVHSKIKNHPVSVELKPPATINSEARLAIEQADLIVIAPGNLYGTLLPAIIVDGVAKSIADTKAKVVAVANLVTKPGQTDGWHVVDYIKTLEEYIGDEQIDAVLYNTSAPSPELLGRYASEGEFPVLNETNRFAEIKAQPFGADLVDSKIAKQDKHDTAIQRTLIRHDGYKTAQELLSIMAKIKQPTARQ